ncbi:2Fe-2S iron-sulfur cluster-binding protein [Chromobacterium piscinae]|uniref:2Fe-2S iron-sulfur cluster-binding protein n=1 Tax=Chromobacterium piscinae TaxID=686831 RepID=UPI00320B47FD
MPTIIFEYPQGEWTAEAPAGGALASVCDVAESPVPFHCRSGNCGTCRVAILEGEALLEAADGKERGVLATLGLSAPAHRLACQVKVGEGAGQIRVRPLSPRMPRVGGLKVPVRRDAEAGRLLVRLSDERTGEIAIPGVSEPEADAVVVIEFQPLGEKRAREVIARIVDCEPDGDPGLYLVELELLEQDELLMELFRENAAATPS